MSSSLNRSTRKWPNSRSSRELVEAAVTPQQVHGQRDLAGAASAAMQAALASSHLLSVS